MKQYLYNLYGIDVKTTPDGYEFNMIYIKANCSMGKLYKLQKK